MACFFNIFNEQLLFTKPYFFASSTPILLPVISISIATALGKRRGNLKTPPLSGIIPKVASGTKNSAVLAAIIRSAASANSKPPPTAKPLTAAITGLSKSHNSVSPAKPPGPKSASTASPSNAAFKSQPPQKNRSPAPIITATLKSASSLKEMKASPSA